MSDTPPSPRLALIGAGRVGTAVALLLRDAGWAVVGVASRTDHSAKKAAERLGARVFEMTSPPDADCYLIGATDEGIAEIVPALGGKLPVGSVVVHLSGARGVSVLEPLTAEGIEAAALHPVAACPDVETALRRLPGSAWGITCTERAEPLAVRFVEALGGEAVRVAEADRPIWHAASVMTSNGLSALLALGEMFLAETTEASPAGILGPLARGSLENALEGGGGAATLTGPVVRGEVGTVRRHLEAMERSPELRSAYVAMAGVILEVARRAERIDPDVATDMEALLR